MLVLLLEVRVFFAEKSLSASIILLDSGLSEFLGNAFEGSFKDVRGPLSFNSRSALGPFNLHRAEDIASKRVVVSCPRRLLGLVLVWLHSQVSVVLVPENIRILEWCARHWGYQGALRMELFSLWLCGWRREISVSWGQNRTLEGVVLSGAGGVSLLNWVSQDVSVVLSLLKLPTLAHYTK